MQCGTMEHLRYRRADWKNGKSLKAFTTGIAKTKKRLESMVNFFLVKVFSFLVVVTFSVLLEDDDFELF